MNDDTVRLVTIGRVVRRRRRLLAVLALLGALVGLGLSVVFPPHYTTSASVLLSGQWEERELLTQAELATSSVVVDRTADTLGWDGVDGAELSDQVSAGAADGNIIKISGTAETPERAQQLADEVAQQFVAFAARIGGDTSDSGAVMTPEALRKLVDKTSRRITELADAADPGKTVESVQGRTELEKLRTTLREAMEKLDEVGPASARSDMVVMGPAARPAGEAPPTRIQLVVGGALVFFLVAVIAHLAAARVSRRLRTDTEISAALGASVLGTVDVPGELLAHGPKGDGRRAWLRWFLGLDVRWDVPTLQASGGEASRKIRYGRVCARLRDRLPVPGRQLLVIVPDGDEIGRLAAGQLVTEADSDPALRVVGISVDQPLVPDRDTESGAVVVLGAGNWNAEELTGIAEACADAGHEVVGVVVAGAVRPGASRPAGDSKEGALPTVSVGADSSGGVL